jgi:dTDP-glucose 4,6-dehydratase
MRALITGSAGFVGSHTVEWLLKHTSWEIVGLDSFRHRGDAERIGPHGRYRIVCHDLNAPISERTRQRIGPVDYIINCASLSHVDTSISDPVGFWESNTRLIANILEYARGEGFLRTFIHCSTDEVFGPAEAGYAHHEWDTVRPSNPYAASKAAQDALCYSYWRTFGVPIVITHTMNMIAPKQDPEKFLPRVVSRIHQSREVTIHGTEGNIGSRMYLDARNLADAWLFILKNVEPVKYGAGDLTKFNVAGLEEIDNLELAQRVARMMGRPLIYRLEDFHKTRPGHDLRYALDSSKILALGWTPPIPLEDTLREVIEHITKNKEWQE